MFYYFHLCFSNFHVHMHHLEILLKCILWCCSVRWGLRWHSSNELPDDVGTADLRTTFWEVRHGSYLRTKCLYWDSDIKERVQENWVFKTACVYELLKTELMRARKAIDRKLLPTCSYLFYERFVAEAKPRHTLHDGWEGWTGVGGEAKHTLCTCESYK